MNRHERRKAFALGQAVAAGEAGMPSSYVLCCAMMAAVLQEWRAKNPSARPHFALPHREVALCASIDHVPLIFKNDEARELLALFCAGADAIESGNAPTVLMLQAVLDQARVEYELVGVGELGVDVAGRSFDPSRKVRSS